MINFRKNRNIQKNPQVVLYEKFVDNYDLGDPEIINIIG